MRAFRSSQAPSRATRLTKDPCTTMHLKSGACDSEVAPYCRGSLRCTPTRPRTRQPQSAVNKHKERQREGAPSLSSLSLAEARTWTLQWKNLSKLLEDPRLLRWFAQSAPPQISFAPSAPSLIVFEELRCLRLPGRPGPPGVAASLHCALHCSFRRDAAEAGALALGSGFPHCLRKGKVRSWQFESPESRGPVAVSCRRL